MKITTGIASTTHVDKHHQRMAKEVLDDWAKQYKEKFIPHLIDHDWDKQIGVVLYGEVFQLNDGEHALGVVTGIFENDDEKRHFSKKMPNNLWQDCKQYLNIDELKELVEKNSTNRVSHSKTEPDFNIAFLLEKHLDSTQVAPDGRVYIIKKFIASTEDLRIEIYPKDHYPPHFHVISRQRNINARFNLDTLELLSTKTGKIKQKDLKKIQNFFKLHPEILKKLHEEDLRMK